MSIPLVPELTTSLKGFLCVNSSQRFLSVGFSYFDVGTSIVPVLTGRVVY